MKTIENCENYETCVRSLFIKQLITGPLNNPPEEARNKPLFKALDGSSISLVISPLLSPASLKIMKIMKIMKTLKFMTNYETSKIMQIMKNFENYETFVRSLLSSLLRGPLISP